MTKNEILDAISYIGVDPDDFNLLNSYFAKPIRSNGRKRCHGIGHIYRVMIGAALLGKSLEEPRIGLLAFCAAFLHDQARDNDGGDYNHGLRAATQHFDRFNKIWDKYKLSKYERDYVCAATANHTKHSSHNFKECREVSVILRDADALDRCRFKNGSKLNPSFLELPESKKLIKAIESICNPTYDWIDDISLVDFITKATTVITPPVSTNPTYDRPYSPDTVLAPILDNQVFVFNQKQSGRSKMNSAKAAVKYFGAAPWVGEGLSGKAYAIPTDAKDGLKPYVDRFICFAKANPNLEFLVTKIACGGVGKTVEEVAPLFKAALGVQNILLPKDFVDELLK